MNLELLTGWHLTGSAAGRYSTPSEIDADGIEWIPAIVPGTVAQALRDAGRWSIDEHMDFDAGDWWYRVDFELQPVEDGAALRFDGLATLCDIWLNGEKAASSDNMFLPLLLASCLPRAGSNRLHLCFRSLNEALSLRKPRPRWKTNLVKNQNLRFFRCSLLGHIPGWSPPVAPVGPWRAVSIVGPADPQGLKLDPWISGESGIVEISFTLFDEVADASAISLTVGDETVELDVKANGKRFDWSGRLEIKNVVKWWPHTHGEPRLYPASLGFGARDNRRTLELAPIGFREIVLDRSDGGFVLLINNRSVFCRGACWGVSDIVSLSDDVQQLRSTLELVKRSGANMLRIGGTMIYESDNFYRICDEFGIMVWQDFQFACMDYPMDEEDFVESVRAELTEQLRRQSLHACLVVHCGGSELEQQPAMMGLASDLVASLEVIRLSREVHRQMGCRTAFADSSPTGGILPVDTNQGVAHYFGVGAYLKKLCELRSHDVRFASECLGFANIPCQRTRDRLFSGSRVVTHHPLWKARTPRDSSAGWDFEDVRDFYLQGRYGVDPVQLRWQEPERYLQLSEVVSGEIMSRVMQEWRSGHSNCDGALVWFLKDLWSGAGWGIIDGDGLPKAAYYLLKQVWQPQALLITDESLNGLHFHLVNETDSDLRGSLRVTLVKNGNVRVAQNIMPLAVESAGLRTVASAAIMEGFFDITHSYKFGPPAQDLVHAEYLDEQQLVVCENTYFLDGREVYSHPETRVSVTSAENEAGVVSIEISSSHFLYRVCLDTPGYLAEDNYFNLMPDATRVVSLEPEADGGGRFRGYLSALNLDHEIRIG